MLLQLVRSSRHRGARRLQRARDRARSDESRSHAEQRRHAAHGLRAVGRRRERPRKPAEAQARPGASVRTCRECVVVPLQDAIARRRLVRRSGVDRAGPYAPPLAQHHSPDGKRVLGVVHPARLGKHERRHRGRLCAASVQSDQSLRAGARLAARIRAAGRRRRGGAQPAISRIFSPCSTSRTAARACSLPIAGR